MKLITETGKLEAAIKSIQSRGAKLDTDIHTAACSVLEHVKMHRDCTIADRLIAAMPRSSRGKTLREWFEKYSPMAWDNTDKAYHIVKADKKTPEAPFETEKAMDMPFWTTIEKTQKDFNIMEAYARFVSQIENADGKGKVKASDLKKVQKAMAGFSLVPASKKEKAVKKVAKAA